MTNPTQSSPRNAMYLDGLNIDITKQNLEECLSSARFWAKELPQFAHREQNRADFFAILAGIFAVITGASVYPVAQEGTPAWARYLIALPAIAAAICAVFPNVRNYAETATRARELATAYGPLVGVLIDAVHAQEGSLDQADLHNLMRQFHEVKGRKDQLRRLPDRSRKQSRTTRSRSRTPNPAASAQSAAVAATP